MLHVLASVAVVGSLIITPVSAEQDLTTKQLEELLKELKGLGEQVKERKSNKHSTALQAYQAAVQTNVTAYKFYLDCYKLLNFEQKERREREYRDWKDANEKKLRSVAHGKAMRFQLQWLVLAIKAENSKDIGPLIPAVYAYMDNLIAEYDELGSSGRLVRQSVQGTVFAEAYGLDTALDGKRWEFTPLNFSGIFDKVILPYYRAVENKTEVLKAWDKRISYAAQRAAKIELKQAEIDFKGEILPRLKWGKLRDLFALGDRATAIAGMVGIIKTNIGHDDAERWVRELAGLVEDRLLGIDSFAEEDGDSAASPAG